MSDKLFESVVQQKVIIDPIVYKGGYKYQLTRAILFNLGKDLQDIWSTGRTHMQGNFLTLRSDGHLLIQAGYSWDGASCFPDFDSVRRAALCHDAIYQLIREGVLPDYARLLADRLFRQHCIEDGLPRLVAFAAYRALRMFGYKAATPGQARKEQQSPKHKW